jgi:serine/threonine protein kinase
MKEKIKTGPGDRVEVRQLTLGPYRGAILAAYEDLDFLQAIFPPEKIWSHQGLKVLLDSRNRVGAVRFPLSGGREAGIVVKEFSSRGLARLKSLVLPSKAARAWRGAIALKERGVDTASPVAYLERRKRGSVRSSFFLAEEIKAADEIRGLFRGLPPSELQPLLRALAAHLSLCHDRGVLHRDLSDGNILVKRDEGGNFRFYFLDTNRVRLRQRLGGCSRIKNLIRLGVPAEFQDFFLQEYFRGKTLRKRHRFWYRLNKRIFTGYMEAKKKLRLRKIARKLGIQ